MSNVGKRSKGVAKIEVYSFDAEIEQEDEVVSIRCLKPMIVRVTGEATQTKYIFNGMGSILDVDAKDVESIMRRNKRIQSCCGSYSSPYFELV